VCEHEDRTLLLATLVLRDGTLIADWDCNDVPLPPGSFKVTTQAFEFRALLTEGGAERLELAKG
jgi:hypothetical protein